MEWHYLPYPSLQDRELLKAELRWEIEATYLKSLADKLCVECRRELELTDD